MVMLLTSIILYIVPHGRIAYWADWRLWGLSKEQWGALHINAGLLLLIAVALHIFYNWKPIVSYLKSRTGEVKLFTGDFSIAVLLVLVCLAGTWAEMPPFSTITDFSEGIKDAAAERYGEPPYGHAELSSLLILAKRSQIDPDAALEAIGEAGYSVQDKQQTLKEIARENGVSPQQIYEAMAAGPGHDAAISDVAVPFPVAPMPGTGSLTLADLCIRHNLDMRKIIRHLGDNGISAAEDMTIKAIGETNQRSPVDIYEEVRAAAGQSD